MDENGNIIDMTWNAAGERGAAAQDPAPDAGALSPEDVEKLVERILMKYLARFQMEANGRAAQARSEGRAEAERLAGMSEGERRHFEAEAARERDAALNRREEELNRRELRAWVAEELVYRNLPRELAECIDCADPERSAACLEALEKAFRAAVQQAVDDRLSRGRSLPRSGGDFSMRMNQRMRAAAGLSDAGAQN